MKTRAIVGDDAAVAARREMATLREAWGAWLQPVPWTHFATLTARQVCSEEALMKECARWVRRLERRTQRRVNFFIAAERGAAGLIHAHALIIAPGASSGAVRSAWKAGYTAVQEYDPSLGATYYVTKEMARNVVDFDLRLPQ